MQNNHLYLASGLLIVIGLVYSILGSYFVGIVCILLAIYLFIHSKKTKAPSPLQPMERESQGELSDPEIIVTQYFKILLETRHPDWSLFVNTPNFFVKKIHTWGAKQFSEFHGVQLLEMTEHKASVLYAITNIKGDTHRFVCRLKKIHGIWKISAFDPYEF